MLRGGAVAGEGAEEDLGRECVGLELVRSPRIASSYSVSRKACIVLRIAYSLQRIALSIHCTAYILQSTLYGVRCTERETDRLTD